MELTYDQEGRVVGPGHRGASLAVLAEGPYSRILRGHSGYGDIAMKIQKETSPLDNAATDARWRREFRALSRYGGEEPGLLSAEPIPGFESEGDDPPRFEPLFLCREQGILFHLPCPRCMRVHVLADCTDDAALAGVGLPVWGSARERFVWCSACGKEDPVFYTRKERQGAAPVRDFIELVRDLREVVDRGRDADPLAGELLAGLERSFPCHTCEHRAACYPRPGDPKQGLAEARLTPVSMNEFYAWPLPLCELAFDEAADLLSGAGPAEMTLRYGKRWRTPALQRMKEQAVRRDIPPDALESLAAKLDVVAQAVQSVHRLHVLSGSPHLSLSPAHVLVQPGEGGTPLVRLASPESPPVLKGLRLPPHDLVAPYAAPPLRDERFGREYPVRIHVGKVWSGAGGTFFGAVIQAKGLPSESVSDRDQIRFGLSDPGWDEVEFWCQRLPAGAEKLAPGSLAIATAPADLTDEQLNDLKAAKGQAPLFGKATVYRDFGVPLDVHALGMLLFRALLVNEAQSFPRVVEELVTPISSSLTLLAKTRPNASLEDFERMIREELTREPAARIAHRRNVRNEPARTDADRIPEEAWTNLLILGFRAVTFLPGFSLCPTDRDDAGGDHGAPTLGMLGRLEEIGQEVASALLTTGPQPIAVAAEEDEDVVSATPLTDTEIRQITGEVSGALEEQVGRLRDDLDHAEKSRVALAQAWEEMYEAIVGIKSRERPPTEAGDERVTLIATTARESIECITQMMKSVAHFGGDELGETVPKIRMMIQDALHDKEGLDTETKVRRIKRQLKALRFALFGIVKTFLDAHTHSTKLGTESLLRLLEKGLFEPVAKGRREKAPDADEIRRRFTELAKSLPGKHHRVFQPFFQQHIKDTLKQVK